MNLGCFHRYRWFAGLSVLGFAAGIAPAVRAEDPEWFKLNGLPEVSVGVEAEGSTEQTRVSGGSSTYDHTSVTPLVGLHTTGSIYHPNLLAFDLSGDLGWGWDNMTSGGPGSGQTRNESAELLRYLAQFNLLSAKPYNVSVFAAQDHTFRDYGTFNTYTVDANRYGGRINCNAGEFSLNADLGYRDETASGLTDSSQITETYFNFLGIHQRKSGQTTLSLHASELENVLNYGSRLDTSNWSAGLSDSETFGHRKQINAGTGLSYSQSDYSGQQIDTLNASENLLVNHRPNLDSYLMMNFNRSELNPIVSSRVQGTAGVRHQLYESLTSSLEGHGTHQEDTAAGGGSTFDQYGLGLSENYTKRLQSWGRLAVGTGLVVDHQDQDSSGAMLTTFAEPHQLYLSTSLGYHPVYLNRPRVVDSTIVVSAGADTLANPADYTIVHSGELTEIKLVVPPGSHLQGLLQTNDNLSVTVTYQSDPVGSSSYDTFSANGQFRLDLFNRFGVYGRVNWLDNNAPPVVLTQTLTDLVGGVDYHRKWFRTGAELESYDSNFTRYQSLRLFQNFEFDLTGVSSLSLDFSQSFYTYPGSPDQSQYQFMARYNTLLPMSIKWYVEGGGLVQQVAGNQLVQGMARTGLGWTRGKLSLRAGYEFNSQSTAAGGWSEERIKHRFFTYLRRSF